MLRANWHQLLRLNEVNFDLVPILQVHELCDNFCHRYISCLKGKMPIDLVIDEREGGSVPKTEGLPGDSNNNANRSNADSTSHTDGASTPEVVCSIFFSQNITTTRTQVRRLGGQESYYCASIQELN